MIVLVDLVPSTAPWRELSTYIDYHIPSGHGTLAFILNY